MSQVHATNRAGPTVRGELRVLYSVCATYRSSVAQKLTTCPASSPGRTAHHVSPFPNPSPSLVVWAPSQPIPFLRVPLQ